MEFVLRKLPAGMLAAATSLAMASAYAVEPANIQVGPLYIAPTLNVETRYVDNLFRSGENEQSSWVLDTLPKIHAWLQNGHNTYSLAYQLQDFRYGSSHSDDFTDHQANLDIHHEFNVRNALNLNAQWYDGHEERGTGLSEGGVADLISEPVEVETLRYGGDYTLGSRESSGRLVARYQSLDTEYQNFRETSQFRDRDEDTITGTFYWKLWPRTDALAEVRYTDSEYDRSDALDRAGSLDSEEFNYYVGLAWVATAKTTGSVRLGMYDREYDSSLREDDDGFSWEVEVDYRPRSYSIFKFGTRRFTQETNGLGDAINTEEYTLNWDHDWSGRSATRMSLEVGEDDYKGASRTDDRIQLELRYTHTIRRWFDLSGGYRFEDRDSSARINDLDYDRNVYFIEAELSL